MKLVLGAGVSVCRPMAPRVPNLVTGGRCVFRAEKLRNEMYVSNHFNVLQYPVSVSAFF